MAKYKTAELSGAWLDAAVAECGEWKTAHEQFPTMTLDSTFKGWRVYEHSGSHCVLMPNNPMRQEPQHFQPSTDWRIGGPIIRREKISLYFEYSPRHPQIWHALAKAPKLIMSATGEGETPLIAAMRAYVASKFGDEVELHD